jgi:GT2 family glycosyltransferase
MKLSIVIVNFNTKDLLKQCLTSLISSNIFRINSNKNSLKFENYEIIVVDNGSMDGSKEYLRDLEQKKFRNNSIFLKVIFNDQNLGFAKAVNQGIKQTKGDYILLLNSDTVVKPGALLAMINFARTHPLAGVVGGRLLNPDGTIQGSCYHLPGIGRAIKEWWLGEEKISEKYAPKGKEAAEVESVVGGSFLIPREVIDKVGLLDERFFMYFEDLDYCRRVRKAGFKVYWVPKAEFIHYHGASGERIPEKTHQWLVESSKIYHGKLKYWLITFIIWSGQKWQRFWRK